MKFAAVLVLFFLPLSAMAQANNQVVLSNTDVQALLETSKKKNEANKKEMETESADAVRADLIEDLNDKTRIYFQRGYGVYVTYTADDGNMRMWFPGNSVMVNATWTVRDVSGTPMTCFHYLNGTDVVTGEVNATECVPPTSDSVDGGLIGERKGDAFDLLSGRVPYVKDVMDVPVWPSSVSDTPKP